MGITIADIQPPRFSIDIGAATPVIEAELMGLAAEGQAIDYGNTNKQPIDYRQRLNSSFAKLSAEQAATLLSGLLAPSGARLHFDFRRLSRAVRLELLLHLAMRLDTQTSKQFHDTLTATGDAPLKNGLRLILPDCTNTQLDKFLQALVKRTPYGVPLVRLHFRNQGTFSADNHAASLTRSDVPDRLGPRPDNGQNQMEIQGVVSFHRPDAGYRFGRTIIEKSWYLAAGTWKLLHHARGPDNTPKAEQDNHPDNGHIYSIGAPGFRGPITNPTFLSSVSRLERDGATEGVYMINATESVEVKVGQGPWKQVTQQDWLSVTWLEKVNGTWRRKPGRNMIKTGSLNGLDGADAPSMVGVP